MGSTPDGAGLFEVMYGCRSMRRLRPAPVPEEILLRLVEAGTRAPSGENAQHWRFVIVRDRQVVSRMAAPWRTGIGLFLDIARRAPARPGEDLAARRRTLRAVRYLAEHFEQTPALICVCAERDRAAARLARAPGSVRSAVRHLGVLGALRLAGRARSNMDRVLWATAYPAAQNVLLAARALGLGAVMTMPQTLAPPGTYERILGLPRQVRLAAVIPVGYPVGRFGPVGRPPAHDFVSWDRYGQRSSSAGASSPHSASG